LVLTGCSQTVVETKSLPSQKDVGEPVKAEVGKQEEAEFVEHVDGDTAKFRIGGKVETVRFLLIDTPETHHPKLGEQPLGKEAGEFTRNMLEHKMG